MRAWGISRDITEAKRLQSRIFQIQKMDSIGRLAGGIAHDFNNLLTVITGYLDLALLDLPADHPLQPNLTQIGKAVDSAASLIRQLLAFSRQQIITPQVIDAHAVIAHVERMIRRLLSEEIAVLLRLSADDAQIRFDPTQLEQILINLAVNARDAMPTGGKLIIETASIYLDEASVHQHAAGAPGRYLLLAISDTGTGMSAEVQANIFEPFFTTKDVGKGTGLGLAMVYGAVTQNKGFIEVCSEPGKGTTFKIYLPQIDQEADRAAHEPALALPSGGQTIALVEDNAVVRAVTTRMLEQLGYRVLTFDNGVTALAGLRSLDERLDLLITDMIMPEMNGYDLAQAIRALRPAIKILFTSGYPAQVTMHHSQTDAGIEFLPEPYSVATLARRVREVLDRPAPG